MKQIEIQELIAAWQQFFNSKNSWQEFIQDCRPITSPNGMIYELPNFLNRDNESFAVVDMRKIAFAEPHYHPDLEIYFVLQGTADVFVGGNKQAASAGDVVIIPPYKAHFTIPDKNFIIGCVNTPPYRPESYLVLTESNLSVGFDRHQFTLLTQQI